MSATCIVATFGNRAIWDPLAERAIRSAELQTVVFDAVVHCHAHTLSDARNAAAESACTEWLCFLDADDELDAHYHEAMIQGPDVNEIRRPATLGVHSDGHEDDYPVMIPRCDLRLGNCVVIGAFIRREEFLAVGGFSDDPILEDWDLFTRLYLAGAGIADVPEAIYRVHVLPDSRNKNLLLHGRIYNSIKNRYRTQWQAHEEMRQVTS